ncbi:MAG: YraN family protein [Bacteroidota bacterium]
MNRCDTGRRAEQLAAGFLRARGYRIWKTNWRWGKRELDLVAIYRGWLVVVEVKSMVGNRVNHPSVVVDEQKQRNIVLAAEGFIRRFNSRRPTRFDVIAVYYHGDGVKIEHFEDAFNPQNEF